MANNLTAVEWLEKKLIEAGLLFEVGEAIEVQQAKEMEKQIAHEYAKFAIRCDREEMKILNFEDWIKL
jgi:hypothetical protein